MNVPEQPLQNSVVQRRGTLNKGVTGEYDEADAVVTPRGDEVGDDIFCRAQPVWLEVRLTHAPRHIEGYSNVHALASDDLSGIGQLRSCNGYYHEH